MSMPSCRVLVWTNLVALSFGAAIGCKKTEPAPETANRTNPSPAGTASPATGASNPPVANGPGVLGKATIRGTVHFTGKPPEAKGITTPDPFCARQGIKEEDVVVAPAGGLKNVLIRIVKGANGTYPAPSTEAVVDQSGCMYRPRVQAVVAGQAVAIKNSDQTLHNVHTYKGASTVFNQAQIPGMGPMTKTFSDGGQIIKFKCDVHPWMTGWVAVATNPFFAVTGDDGSFAIDKVPPGAYTLEAWHERLGTRTSQEITVDDDHQPATLAFDFTSP